MPLLGSGRGRNGRLAVEHRPADSVSQLLVIQHKIADRIRQLPALPATLLATGTLSLALCSGRACRLYRVGRGTERSEATRLNRSRMRLLKG